MDENILIRLSSVEKEKILFNRNNYEALLIRQ